MAAMLGSGYLLQRALPPVTMKTILWIRNTLRLDDNPALLLAARSEWLLPLFIHDTRLNRQTGFMAARIGPYRRQFINESLEDLRLSLIAHGSNLMVLEGDPVTLIRDLARQYQADRVIVDQHPGPEEARQLYRLRTAIQQTVIEEIECNGLCPESALPFDLAELPVVFSAFRRKMEREPEPDRPLAPPAQLPAMPPEAVKDRYVASASNSNRSDWPRGGETAALQHLDNYIFQQQHIRHYKDTRNGLLEPSDSSRFSPWLAQGAISVRRLWHSIRDFQRQHGRDEQSDWLLVELLWREFFRWTLQRYGSALFLAGGLKSKTSDTQAFSESQLRAWQQGSTGMPLIDACMQELSATGFLSNRGRQNAASFLIHDLGIHWRYGAAWFEQQLIDYDAASNWGNWAYIAGVGNDPRPLRRFNILSQAQHYDPEEAYVSHWLPALHKLPVGRRHSCFLEPDNPHHPLVIPPPETWQPYFPAKAKP
ncbi:MAG: DASH family cryptochrome [Gammaproteobacteria bacterium HGW-Gammaproteobacteria-14]|nr:MAG: DASH family cryptochrome [Gammaproteobacteria bacterium HGW-Gammaproteobacteria-14]